MHSVVFIVSSDIHHGVILCERKDFLNFDDIIVKLVTAECNTSVDLTMANRTSSSFYSIFTVESRYCYNEASFELA